MQEVMQQGGPFMWLIGVCGLAAIALALKKAIDLSISSGSSARLRRGLDAILQLGVFAIVIGALAQALGIVMALDEIRKAADISPAIVMMGAQISFYPPLFGAVVFLVSLAAWGALRFWLEMRTNATVV